MLNNCNLQQQPSFVSALLYLLLLAVALFFIYNKAYSQKRLNAIKKRPISEIDDGQVIVALQLSGVFLQMSERKKLGFSKINIQPQGIYVLIEKLKEMLGIGLFYKIKTSVKNIKTLIQTLNENPKVTLFLYTTLNIKVAQFILEQLCLTNYFSVYNRRSCNDEYNEQYKHPTEIDFNTKRVIIVTGSKNDHLEEYSKYFLVVKGRELGHTFKGLSKVINRNKDIDELHNDLGQLKAQIQSDIENVDLD